MQTEDYMVRSTREVSKGLIVAGSEVCYLDGIARPGPTAGGRLHSGLHAAEIAFANIMLARDKKATRRHGYETAGHFLHDDTIIDCEEKMMGAGFGGGFGGGFVGSAEVYKCCKCKFQCGRDENAARNIFIKYLYKKRE